jgi:hypothetical protein
MSIEKKAVITMPEGPSLDALLRRLLEVPPDFLTDSPTDSLRGSLNVSVVDSLNVSLVDSLVDLEANGTGRRASGTGLSAVNVVAVVHDVVASIFGDPNATANRVDANPVDALLPNYSEAGRTAREVVAREGLERFEAAMQIDTKGRAAGFALLFAWLLADPWFHRNARTKVSQKRVWYTFTTLSVAHGGESSAAEWHADPKRREEIVRSMLATLELLPEGETEAQADDRLTRVSSAQRKRLLAAAREAEARAELVRKALAAKAAQEAADKYTRE